MKINEIIRLIENGSAYRINFENKTFKLDGQLVTVEFDQSDDVKQTLLDYFENYKTSTPSSRSNSKYFFALEEHDLSTKQLIDNEIRYVARARLELYVLWLIINKLWDFGDKWYWQSEADPKLVLFKKWFD